MASLETNGCEPERGAQVSAGVPSPVQVGNLSEQSISSDNCSAPSNVNRKLCRSVESKCHGRGSNQEKVYKAHEARGRGVLFEGIPGSHKERGLRLVIDLSQLNTNLADMTFKMDTLQVVKEALQQGMWVTPLDLSDAYQHVSLLEQDQQYVCLQVGEKRFISMVLTFGLKTAPWAFTEVVKQIKKVGSQGSATALTIYLDDWLNANNRRKECARLTELLFRLCHALGLLVNVAKSELIPVQRIKF